MLEHLSHLEIARAVRPRLDHRHQLRPRRQLRTEIVQVVYHSIQIDLQYRRMALAREGVGKPFETELPRPLEQHGVARHGVASDAGDALARRGEELPLAGEERSVAFQLRPDADERVDARPGDHSGHAAVQFVVRKPALGDVRQDERPAARQRHVVQVVQRQRQRIEVEVVGVVDEHRIVDALLHLEAHRHLGSRREGRFGKIHRGAERLDDLRIAARSLVADDRLRHAGERRRVVELPPGEMRGDHTPQRLVMAMIDDPRGAASQNHLFQALLVQIEEILLVGVPDRGEDDHVGTDDALQPLHFPRLRNARLEDRQPLVALEHQHRQRHAQLRIVTLRRTVALHPRGQFLGDPFLDDRLAVRPGDAHHRPAELRPVVGGQPLQRLDGVPHHDIAAPGSRIDGALGQEGADPAGAHLPDEIVRIVVGAAHGHEHRAGSQLARQRAAVGDDRLHRGVRTRKPAAHDGGDLR